MRGARNRKDNNRQREVNTSPQKPTVTHLMSKIKKLQWACFNNTTNTLTLSSYKLLRYELYMSRGVMTSKFKSHSCFWTKCTDGLTFLLVQSNMFGTVKLVLDGLPWQIQTHFPGEEIWATFVIPRLPLTPGFQFTQWNILTLVVNPFFVGDFLGSAFQAPH